MSKHFSPTPWARMALGTEDTAAIEARARALSARVTAVASSPSVAGPWTVHATSVPGNGIRESVIHGRGPLALVIAGVLDRFEAQREIVDEELADIGFPKAWTPEEILQVAAQSGMDVRRA